LRRSCFLPICGLAGTWRGRRRGQSHQPIPGRIRGVSKPKAFSPTTTRTKSFPFLHHNLSQQKNPVRACAKLSLAEAVFWYLQRVVGRAATLGRWGWPYKARGISGRQLTASPAKRKKERARFFYVDGRLGPKSLKNVKAEPPRPPGRRSCDIPYAGKKMVG